MPQISVDQLFDDNQAKLNLSWAAGKGGGSHLITGDASLKPTLGLVGHMNFIHPFRVQVLGPAEFNYLNGLSEEALPAIIDRLFTTDLAAVIIANAEALPKYLAAQADRCNTAVFSSTQPSPHIVEVLRIYLARVLAESTTLHGVFLDVLEIGVLITGASAIGKSELALELISRGHGLIADDIVEFHRTSPETLEGRCPPILKDFLEVRGIGIINIKTIFGETAVRPRKTLRVIVHLEDHSNEKFSDLDRLQVNATFQEILGVAIRKVTIPVAAGLNLAVLVEAAVRSFVLSLRGIDSTREFIERQQRLMDEGM
jgi:HPr kinase/phosphorylase